MVRAEPARSTSVDMNTDHQGSATDISEFPWHFGAVPAQLDFTTTGGAAQAHPERNRVYDPRPRVAISESILPQILQSLQLTQERLAESQYQHQQAQAQATETQARLIALTETNLAHSATERGFLRSLTKLPIEQRPSKLKHDLSTMTIKQLDEFVDSLNGFFRHVDPASDELQRIIQQLRHCTYRVHNAAPEEERVEYRVVDLAEDNFKNLQAHSPVKTKPITYEDISPQAKRLDRDIYMYAIGLFENGVNTSAEIRQFKKRALEHPELETYVELVLYLYHTKSNSPLVMWMDRSKKTDPLAIGDLPPVRNKSDGTKAATVSSIESALMQRLDDIDEAVLQPWQVKATMLFRYCVVNGQKKAAEYVEHQVSEALDSRSVPDVSSWARGAAKHMNDEKEFQDLQRSNREDRQRQEYGNKSGVPVNLIHSCSQCKTKLNPPQANFKHRCTSCHAKWREANPGYQQFWKRGFKKPSASVPTVAVVETRQKLKMWNRSSQ